MKLPKSKYNFALKLFFTIGAFIYIFLKLKTTLFSDDEIEAPLNFSTKELVLIVIVLLLMSLNWLLESIKWKGLLVKVEEINLSKSIKSVLIGVTCSLFTPFRLGDYLGRPLLIRKENKSSSVLANILGSICQNIITMGLGLIGLILLLTEFEKGIFGINDSLFIFITIVTIIIFLIITLINSGSIIKLLNKFRIIDKLKLSPDFLHSYNRTQFSIFLALSLIRYLVFFTQYFILLKIFGVNIHLIDAFTGISLSYIFLFSIPGVPIADIGIRGSLALFFLGMFSPNQFSILYASTALWLINLAIPGMIGSYFLIRAPRT